MSRVFVEPNQAVSQTSRMSCSRETTLPSLRTRTRSSSNSFAVSWSSSSRRNARCPSGSIRTRDSLAWRLAGAAAQQGPGPGEQLGEPERLRDVVVGAGVEPDDGVDLVGPGGEDEDRHACVPRRAADDRPRARRARAARGRGRAGRGPREPASSAAAPSERTSTSYPSRRRARASGSEIAGSSSARSTRVMGAIIGRRSPAARPCGTVRRSPGARRSSDGVTMPMPRRWRRRSSVIVKPDTAPSSLASASST